MKVVRTLTTALGQLWSSPRYVALTLLLSLLAGLLFFSLPVLLIPGNNVGFQFSILTPLELSLYVILAIMVGTILAIQVYAFGKAKKRYGVGGAASALAASLFAVKTCPMCLAALLGALGIGFGTTLTLVSHGTEIALFSTAIGGISLYYSSKALVECNDCCKVEKTERR